MKALLNRIPASRALTYADRIALLKERKLAQTQEKVVREGGLNEDDYGRVVQPEEFAWQIIPNHADGSFYGYSGWTENFCDLMAKHPLYVDPADALAGKWMFFMSRMKGSTWNPDYSYDHLKPAIAKYDIKAGIGADAHFAPDYTIGLELGWGGLLAALRRGEAEHGEAQREFYASEIRTVEAIQGWIRRTVALIGEMEAEEQHPQLKENLRQMREANEWVAEHPPRTMREACQWLAWFNMASRTYNRDGAGGQIDELLRPYYERDMAEGRLTDEEAIYYIACLLINDTHYYQLAGPGPDGRDVTSQISYLILEAAARIDTTCNLTIRVHDGLDPQFFAKSVECLFTYKNGWPRYSGDKALVDGFMRNGYPAELARRRIAVGCNWMSLPGLEYTLNDCVKVNAARVFEVAFTESAPGVDQLWASFERHLRAAVAAACAGIDWHLKHQVHNEPELVLNLLSHGPVEQGADITQSARYLNMGIDGAGLATVADSFAALEQRVEREGRLAWAEVAGHLQRNFEGPRGEYVRLMLKASEKYGQGESLGDRWAVKVARLFAELVREQMAHYPYIFIPGWFSWAQTITLGRAVGATPNGRRAGEPINHGANPTPGFRPDGAITAMANSICAVQPGYGNTTPVQLEFDPSLANTPESVAKVAAYIRTIFDRGATLLNINIMDRAKVLEAHQDPSKYPDLVVRVTGFTAYFSMLSPEFRQLVVDRIIATC